MAKRKFTVLGLCFRVQGLIIVFRYIYIHIYIYMVTHIYICIHMYVYIYIYVYRGPAVDGNHQISPVSDFGGSGRLRL